MSLIGDKRQDNVVSWFVTEGKKPTRQTVGQAGVLRFGAFKQRGIDLMARQKLRGYCSNVNLSATEYVLPLLGNVTNAIERSKGPKRPAIHSLTGDLGVNDPVLRHALHESDIFTVGIPKTIEPINPKASPEEALSVLNEAGLNSQRTPHQVQLAWACGYSRPVIESHIASLLARGAGEIRYKGPKGTVVQLGMTVVAHNGAVLLWIR